MHRIPLSLLLVLGLLAPCLISCGGGSSLGAAPPPVITSVEPASGGLAGRTPVVIKGELLANAGVGANEVLIGGNPAENIKVIDGNTITCQSPAGTMGAADVTVIKEHGADTLGSGYMYYPPPTVASMTPDKGTRFGGTEVTVVGSGFLNNAPGETLCLIDNKQLLNVVIVDDTTLIGSTPTSYIETVKDVRVANNNGVGTLVQGFTYVGPTPLPSYVTPDFGKVNGGELVTIVGDYFTVSGGQLTVVFGETQAGNVTRIDDQHITCTTPQGPSGEFVDVVVSNSNGPGIRYDAYFYLPAPVPSAVVPGKGLMLGGDSVTIQGEGFMGGTPALTFVTFGGGNASSVTIVDDNTITCVTPPHPMGTVDVAVGNENGTSTLSSAFEYVSPVYWDTNSGTKLNNADQTTVEITFSGGKQFPMYGATYNHCFIGENGHINLDHPYTQNLPRFLLTVSPIINPWQADLTTNSGTLSYYQDTDRFIVTYDLMPENNKTQGKCKVQVHMLWNGIIGILWNGQDSNLTEGPLIGIAPILTAWPPMVDLSSPQTANSSQALSEQFATAGSFDMDNGHMLFMPDGSGGYTSSWVSGVPAAP